MRKAEVVFNPWPSQEQLEEEEVEEEDVVEEGIAQWVQYAKEVGDGGSWNQSWWVTEVKECKCLVKDKWLG